MVSPTPHNKFIFILTSDPSISSLNFFLRAIFTQNWAISTEKRVYNAMGKILST